MPGSITSETGLETEEPVDFPLRWKRDVGYQLAGVVGADIDGPHCLFMTGISRGGAQRTAKVWCLDSGGDEVWSHELSHPDEQRLVCVYPNIVRPSNGAPCLFYSYGSSDNDHPQPGYARLCDCVTGEAAWETRTRSHHAGNGSCLCVDIDGDGASELLFWDSNTVFCLDAEAGSEKWRFDDRLQICHGRPTLADVNGDGLPELVFGTEYANDDSASSLVALDGHGDVVWRTDGIPDDLGSTPIICADADGDGAPEFYVTGLDLEGRGHERWSSLWAFGLDGRPTYRAPCGCGGLAVAPFCAQDHLSGAGITNSRDGGAHGKAEIRCLDLRDGSVEWSRPLPRVYLDAQNPVAADVTGDGTPDLVAATGNPSGYGHRDAWKPFGDVYAVDGRGNLLWSTTVGDFVHQPFVGDIDGDGRNELLLPCGDGSLLCHGTPGRASAGMWEMTGGGVDRKYAAS